LIITLPPICIDKNVPPGTIYALPKDMLAKLYAGTLTEEELEDRAKECAVVTGLRV
jgi:hypothetical protein